MFTQAKRLDQVPGMVQDAVCLMEDVPSDKVDVSIEPALPEKVDADLQHALRLMREAAKLQQEASATARRVVHKLRVEEKLSARDVGSLLKVSPQRVSQLERDERTPASASAVSRPS